MEIQQAPAAHVTNVTTATGDANDAKRGVTFLVTRNGQMVTRNKLASPFASPVSAAKDAAKAPLVTRMTRNAGTLYPLPFEKWETTPREGTPERGPAARVTIVTTPDVAVTEKRNLPRFGHLSRAKETRP